MEIWKLSSDPRYEVSNHGKIRRVSTGRVLKPSLRRGYLFVCLPLPGDKKRNWPIHRVVALVFLGNCPDGCVVNHKDGNKLNNHVDNLEYATQQENEAHAVAMGLKASGMRCGTHTHPESRARGLRHGAHTHPESFRRKREVSK